MKSFYALALACLLNVSCSKIKGEGPLVEETRNVAEFDRVSFSIDGSMDIENGPDFRVSVESQQNLQEVIRTEVNDHELVVRYRNGKRVGRNDGIRVRVIMPQLRAVNLSGSGNILLRGRWEGPAMTMRISGSGNLNADEVILNTLNTEISGSGSIRVGKGSAGEGQVSLSGSGSVEMPHVQMREAEVHISGSGSVRLRVSDQLEAFISGSGSVWYYGLPAVRSHISGSGRVIRVE